MTAVDLMSAPSVLVPEDMSLRAAARLLSQAQVSGAPVVNAEGYCVGVLSTTDFLHWAMKEPRPKSSGPATCQPVSAWQIVSAEGFPEESVYQSMTHDPVTVAPTTPLGELARMMLDAHIHRLIVVDEDGQPVGVISTTDILAVLAQAAALAGRGQAEPCPC
jgi:CBS domain-containing protein